MLQKHFLKNGMHITSSLECLPDLSLIHIFGEVVISPFEVRHTDSELSELARQLKSLNGETRVVMEATGNYHAPVAKLLHDAGLYVSVINAKLVHGYGNNELRRVKTDRKDAVKLANYGLDRWLKMCIRDSSPAGPVPRTWQ